MTIEEMVSGLTAALDRNTAAILGKAGSTESTPVTARRPPGRPPANKGPTIAEVKAIADRVKDERDRSVAIALIKKHGAEKIADLDPSKYAAFVAAAEVLLADTGEEAGEATEDL